MGRVVSEAFQNLVPWQSLFPLVLSLNSLARGLPLGAQSYSHLCCCSRGPQGTSMVVQLAPWATQPVALHPTLAPLNVCSTALCCSPGTSHTLARRLQNLPLPPRGPDPCQNHMGSWEGSAQPPPPPCWFFSYPYVGSKKLKHFILVVFDHSSAWKWGPLTVSTCLRPVWSVTACTYCKLFING